MIVYRRHEAPGCGGCIFLVALLLLALGGAPLLFNVLGFLLFAGLFFIFALILGFWGLSYYIRRKVSNYERSQTESHNVFVFLLVNILVKIAQLDGTVTKAETAAIVNFFRSHLGYTQSQLYWVKDQINEAVGSTVSLEALLTEFKGHFAYEPRLILLELVYQVLYANPRVRPDELEMVQSIADYLEVFPYDHIAIRSKYVGAFARRPAEDASRYFEILGLSPGADFEQIKKAYRKLSMKYHPDKVAHLGEEFRKVAEEKMKEINQAYHALKQRYA